jgi:hypothetical protein
VTHRLLFRAASARAGRPIQRQARTRLHAHACCSRHHTSQSALSDTSSYDTRAQINILDMRGLNVGALTGKAMELTGKIAKIDQDHYPETLEACYIINPPWAFSAAFGLVTRFLDEKTRKKVQVMGSGAELLTRLQEALGPDAHLPPSALTGPLEASLARSPAADGLLGAHEVCYAYVSERAGCIARGEPVDTPRAVHGSRSYAQLAALGPRKAGAAGADVAAGGAYLAPPLWSSTASSGPMSTRPGVVPPPLHVPAHPLPPLPLLPPPPLSPAPSLPPRPGGGGGGAGAHAAALASLTSPPPPSSYNGRGGGARSSAVDVFASPMGWGPSDPFGNGPPSVGPGRAPPSRAASRMGTSSGGGGSDDDLDFDGASVYLDAADEEDERSGLVNLWGPASSVSSAGGGPASFAPASMNFGPSSVGGGGAPLSVAASAPLSVAASAPPGGAVGAAWGTERERTYSARLMQGAEAFRAAAEAEAAAEAAAANRQQHGYGGHASLPALHTQPPPPSPRLFAGSSSAAQRGANPTGLEMEAHTRRGGLLREEADNDYDDGGFNSMDSPTGCCGCLRRRRAR